MRPSPTSLTGSLLVFDRTGHQLVAAEPDALSLIDLTGCAAVGAGRTTRLVFPDTRAVAAFGDQLWLVTAGDQLLRISPDGRALGDPVALPFAARAILSPAPCGPAAAVWASVPHVAVTVDGGAAHCAAQPDADAVVPLTGRRFVAARGSRLTLPSGVVAQLPPNTSVLGGVAIADGKSVVLLVTHAGGRQLITVSTSTGDVLVRCATPSSIVRVATQRSIAMIQLEPRLAWLIDLQGRGRDLGTFQLDQDVHDLAIDPTGTRIALRMSDGSIELHYLHDLTQRPAGVPATSPDTSSADEAALSGVREQDVDDGRTPDVADVSDVRAVDVSDVREEEQIGESDVLDVGAWDVSDVRGPDELGSGVATLLALEPRAAVPMVEGERARELLAGELRSVMLWTLDAISRAWDTRRLGYANEGKHPFELEVGAILGLHRGFASEYVEAARARVEEHERALASELDWRSDATPIGSLSAELGLSERAVDVLVVIAAAALWGEIARLYGILGNDAGRATVDELLVQHVLEARHGRDAIAAELDPRAPLIRLGIVQLRGGRARPFAELVVDPVIVDRMRGVAPELGSAIAVRSASCALEELELPRDVLDAALRELAQRRSAPARIAVRGRVGSGRRTLLATLAAEARRQLAVIDAEALPRHPDAFAAELARSLRRAQLAGLVPCVAGLGDVAFGEQGARDVAAEVLRLHPGPIAVIAAPEEPVPFAPGHIAIALPVLDETARYDVWSRALTAAGLEVDDVGTLAARYKIGPGVIRRAVAAAASSSSRRDASATIEGYVRQTRDKRLGQYARRVERLASWSSVVLPPDILDSLRELVGRVCHGRTVFETWGMARMMATSRGLTALFSGPPGTGKTLVAGLIARELGLDLYQVDLSKVMSKWIGETERNLSTIFDAAEDGQVVLLFDEADSLFAKRTEVRSSNDRYANLEVNYLLQRLDAFEGIAILTTNAGTSIDQAFKRRMSFRLSFPFPDEETREQLWRAHLPRELPTSGPLALDALARKYQLSGGYIRNACLRAAFLAAQDATVLHQRHLERAVALEYAELGKLSSGGPID